MIYFMGEIHPGKGSKIQIRKLLFTSHEPECNRISLHEKLVFSLLPIQVGVVGNLCKAHVEEGAPVT